MSQKKDLTFSQFKVVGASEGALEDSLPGGGGLAQIRTDRNPGVGRLAVHGTVKKISGAGFKSPHSNRFWIWLLRVIS